MKNKKGFTLIELLAVIVILAIIALIATPIVLNMINSARKKAAESSAYGFIDAIEYNNGFAQTEQSGYTEINGTDLDATTINVKMKGKKPTSGKVTITNGKVTSATGLCFNNYEVNYDGRKATVGKKCNGSSSSESATPTYTAYQIGDSVQINGTYWDVIANSSASEPTIKLMSALNINNSANASSNVSDLFVESVDDSSSYAIAFDLNGSNVYANSSIKAKLEGDYKSAIENSLDIKINNIGMVGQVELETLGCDVDGNINCDNAVTTPITYDGTIYNVPLYSSLAGSWVNIPIGSDAVFFCDNYGSFGYDSNHYPADNSNSFGVHPVITISKTELQ